WVTSGWRGLKDVGQILPIRPLRGPAWQRHASQVTPAPAGSRPGSQFGPRRIRERKERKLLVGLSSILLVRHDLTIERRRHPVVSRRRLGQSTNSVASW